MIDWKTALLSNATELCYLENYRHREGSKGTWLDFTNDLLAEDFVCESPFSDTEPLSGEWLRRFGPGYTEKSTGRHIQTVPGIERLQVLREFVRAYLPPTALAEHALDYIDALKVYEDLKCNGFADPKIMSASLRGLYVSETSYNDENRTFAYIFRLRDERLFRVRYIETDTREFDDSRRACQVTDGFLSTGTQCGIAFQLSRRNDSANSHSISQPNIHLDDYRYNVIQSKAGRKNGRRIHEFTATQAGANEFTMHFQLVQRPKIIKEAMRALWALSHQITN